MYVAVYLSIIYQLICLSVYIVAAYVSFIYLSVSLSTCLVYCTQLSCPLSISSTYLSIYLLLCLFVYPSVRRSIHPVCV